MFLAQLLSSSYEGVWSGAGDGAKFFEDKSLTAAVVSDGVVDLQSGESDEFNGQDLGVFAYCTKLEAVKLPESLRRIGQNAFSNCEALVHVDIPSGLTEICDRAFFGCKSIETVIVPDGIVDLPNYTFMSCESLKSVHLPSSIKTIGASAFSRCSSLTAINSGALEGVARIGMNAFYCCSSLTTLKLPPTLKSEFCFFWEPPPPNSR